MRAAPIVILRLTRPTTGGLATRNKEMPYCAQLLRLRLRSAILPAPMPAHSAWARGIASCSTNDKDEEALQCPTSQLNSSPRPLPRGRRLAFIRSILARSEERSVGQECVSTCRYWCTPQH